MKAMGFWYKICRLVVIPPVKIPWIYSPPLMVNFTYTHIIGIIKEKPVRASQSFPDSVMKQNYSTVCRTVCNSSNQKWPRDTVQLQDDIPQSRRAAQHRYILCAHRQNADLQPHGIKWMHWMHFISCINGGLFKRKEWLQYNFNNKKKECRNSLSWILLLLFNWRDKEL